MVNIKEIQLNPADYAALLSECRSTSGEDVKEIKTFLGIPIIVRVDVPKGMAYLISRLKEGE